MACPELIGDYFDRVEAKKVKKKGVSVPTPIRSRGSSSTPSVQNEQARKSSVPPVVQKETARGATVSSSVQKELRKEKSTTPAVSKEPVKKKSITPSPQKEPDTVKTSQKVPPIRLQLPPSTSKEPVREPEPEHPPLKLKISRRSLSTETKEPTAFAEDSPTRRKAAQRIEDQVEQSVQPQIAQLRLSEDSEVSSLGTSESSEVHDAKERKDDKSEEAPGKVAPPILKKTIKLPKVPPLPHQKTTLEKRASLPGVQEKLAGTKSRQESAPSTFGQEVEKEKTPKEKTPLPDQNRTLQKTLPAEEVPGSSNQTVQAIPPSATSSGQNETTSPTSQGIEKATVPEDVPDLEIPPVPEVSPPQEEISMETDEPPAAPVEPTPVEESTPAQMVELMDMEPCSSKDSVRDEASAEPLVDEEEGSDYSNSDLESSDSEADIPVTEQNDDDISDKEDFQKKKGQKTSLRADKKKNGYEKGMKAESLISFVKKGDLMSGLVKFEGTNKVEIIPYKKLRILDPAIICRYHIKMVLLRNLSDKPPKEGIVKGLKIREIDSGF